MIKFRTDGFNLKRIEIVEIDRETENSVFIGKNCNAKRSFYFNYFDTWDEAKAFLLENAEEDVRSCRRLLDAANSTLYYIQGLANKA